MKKICQLKLSENLGKNFRKILKLINMIFSIAWKNIWRNKIRSTVVIVAFLIGLFGGIFAVAFAVGMIQQRIDMAIRNEVSHVQMHHPDFQDNYEIKYAIENSSGLVDSILRLEGVKGVSPRIKIFGMASTAGNATGIMINGIDADMEKNVSGLHSFFRENGGSFFKGQDGKPIIIGEKLAKTLKLVYYSLTTEDIMRLSEEKSYRSFINSLKKIENEEYRLENEFDKRVKELLGEKQADKYNWLLKDIAIKYRLRRRVVLSFQTSGGEIAYDAFRVEGVYKTSNSMFDGINVFVRKDLLADISGIQPDAAHEIAVLCKTGTDHNALRDKISEMRPEMLTETWEEILPDIGMYSSMMDFYLIIFMSVILLALGFGIVNTMLMAVLERVKELGMLMAIGMNKLRIFKMIMLETLMLSLTGASGGMLLSWIVIELVSKSGINLSRFYKEGFEAWGFDAHIFPQIGWESFIQVTLLVIVTGILASIYPARKALKLNPSEALRIDM